MLGEQVVGVSAPGPAEGEELVGGGDERPDGERRDRTGRNWGREPVVVLGEHLGDGAEPLDGQPGSQPGEQRGLERRVGEERVDECGPSLVELDAGLDVVEDPEPRWQADLEGMLAQQPLREPVEGGERCLVELVQRSQAAALHRRVDRRVGVGPGHALQRGADPVAELGRGSLGERDRGELAQLGGPGRDQRDDPVDQRGRLAGPGTGFDEQAGEQLVTDLVVCRLVADLAHG